MKTNNSLKIWNDLWLQYGISVLFTIWTHICTKVPCDSRTVTPTELCFVVARSNGQPLCTLPRKLHEKTMLEKPGWKQITLEKVCLYVSWELTPTTKSFINLKTILLVSLTGCSIMLRVPILKKKFILRLRLSWGKFLSSWND